MSSSLRARRMARNHKRLAQSPKLNLVALMDIFTILVLFLMVNNGDVEVLQPDRDITLPDSVSEVRPELALTIKVGADSILVENSLAEWLGAERAEQGELPGLRQLLLTHSAASTELAELEQASGRPVIIMGDSDMPYEVLKRVMSTCADTGYRDISLAVNSAPPSAEEALQLAVVEG